MGRENRSYLLMTVREPWTRLPSSTDFSVTLLASQLSGMYGKRAVGRRQDSLKHGIELI